MEGTLGPKYQAGLNHAAQPKDSQVNQLLRRFQQLRESLSIERDRMTGIAARICGAVPQPVESSGGAKQAGISGLLSEIDDHLAYLESVTAEIGRQNNRILDVI